MKKYIKKNKKKIYLLIDIIIIIISLCSMISIKIGPTIMSPGIAINNSSDRYEDVFIDVFSSVLLTPTLILSKPLINYSGNVTGK